MDDKRSGPTCVDCIAPAEGWTKPLVNRVPFDFTFVKSLDDAKYRYIDRHSDTTVGQDRVKESVN